LLEDWLALAPVDVRAHRGLLAALAERGEAGACEEHLRVAARLFAAEDLDFEPVRTAWRALKARPAPPLAAPVAAQVAAQVAATMAAPMAAPGPAVPASGNPAATGSRASIAVMPLQQAGTAAVPGGLADAL